MNLWASILLVTAAAAITYALRVGMLIALADRALPDVVDRALRNVGPAVLGALAISLAASGESAGGLSSVEALAFVAASLVAWWRRSLLPAVAAGMLVIWADAALSAI